MTENEYICFDAGYMCRTAMMHAVALGLPSDTVLNSGILNQSRWVRMKKFQRRKVLEGTAISECQIAREWVSRYLKKERGKA